MKVVYSFVGRFADRGNGDVAYYMAKPFFDKRYLSAVFVSSYVHSDIPDDIFFCVKTTIIPGLKIFPWGYAFNYAVRDSIFDLKVSKLIKKCDLFFGWANNSLYSLRKAKKTGAKTVIFSPTTHVLARNRLLKEEHSKFGLKYIDENYFIIKKECQEYKEADYVCVFSDFVVNSFLENGIKREKIIFVPYGIDTNKFIPHKKSDDVFRVLSIGKISLRKGTHYLLEAWSRLKLKDSELVLIGDIDRQMINIIKEYKKRCDFKIYGFTPDLTLHYSSASVVICASVEDASTAVGYEALASGIPVIASTNSGLDHIVKDGVSGFIVPAYSADPIEEKLKLLYNNKDILEKMKAAAREDMVKNHSYEKFAQETINTCEKIVSR